MTLQVTVNSCCTGCSIPPPPPLMSIKLLDMVELVLVLNMQEIFPLDMN